MNAAVQRFLFLSFVILSACSQQHIESLKSSGLGNDVSQKPVLEYATVRDLVFSSRCVSCHQQYNSYVGVFEERLAIKDSVFNNRMPKSGGPLSENQKTVLFAWIDAGAPEFLGLPTPDPMPLEPNWQSLSQRLIFPKCLACHNPKGQARFLDLSTREAIFANRDRQFGNGIKLFDFEDVQQSYFLQIVSDTEEPMPPVWSNIPKLSPEEIEVLTRWISLELP